MEIPKPTAPEKPLDIYPKLPEDPSTYRYYKILMLRKQINEEIIKYSKMSKKYAKGHKVLNACHYGSNAIAFASTSTAIVTFTGGITMIASAPLAAIGGLATMCSAGFTFGSNKIRKKQLKHTGTLELARNTLLNLERLSSKLIMDGQVTQEELETILDLEKNYFKGKKELREKLSKAEIAKAFEKGKESMKK